MIRVHLFISGLVQGVFYRQNTKENAKHLGLTGWVRNLPDSRVEAVIEGKAESVERLLEWCKRGPKDARVDSVESTQEQYSGEFKTFEITF